MALSVGELVATLRADNSGWNRGLAAAQLRMRGLTRDASGNLRDLRGRFISEGEAAGRGLAAGIRAHAEQAADAVRKVGPAVAGISVGLPAVAAVATALGGLAAGAVAAGLAVKAFQLAAKPQLEAVTEASEAASKADDAAEKVLLKKKIAADLAAKGGDAYKAALKDVESAQRAATEADKAAETQLKGLPPATRATAVAFAGLKGDYEDWSDSLSGTTMPIFTKGIEILRGLLPTLTPFVKAAAGALGDMLDRVAIGVKGARFKEWAADMSAAAGPALRDFLTVIGNLGKGFMGLLQAFLPVSATMTGGLVTMTAAFAEWGAGLKDSAGFAEFLELADQGGGTLGALAAAAVDLLVAAAPLIGVTTMLATHLAEIISATPAPVLKVLVGVLAAVKVGMIAYAAGSAVVAAANTVMASSTWTAIAGWTRMMAVGLMAYLRIGAGAVASAAVTAAAWVGSALVSIGTWIAAVLRASLTAVAQFTLMAARAVVWAAVMAAQWLIAMGPIGWIIAAVIGLAALIYANWDKIKQWTAAAWDWVWGKIKSVGAGIVASIKGAVALALLGWDRLKAGVMSRVLGLVSYVRGMPGRIKSALGNLGSLLTGAGRNVVTGLWNGIKSMGGWLKGQLISFAKNSIPGPIAKALGISSPSKVMAKAVGRHIPSGIAMGAENNRGVLDRTMAGLVTPPGTGGMAYGGGGSYGYRGGSRGGAQQVEVIVRSDGGQTGDVLVGLLQGNIQAKGGNVQTVLGAN